MDDQASRRPNGIALRNRIKKTNGEVMDDRTQKWKYINVERLVSVECRYGAREAIGVPNVRNMSVGERGKPLNHQLIKVDRPTEHVAAEMPFERRHRKHTTDRYRGESHY